MKNRAKFIGSAILLFHFFVFFAFATENQDIANQQKMAVTIVHNNGSTTKMTNFSQYLIHHTYSSRIYSDVPTSFHFSSNSIELHPIGYDAPFSIHIPFEIIKDIEFSLNDGDDWFSSSYFLTAVTLGDGQVVKGRFFGNFEGETSFGRSNIEFDTYNYNETSVKKIIFDHHPKNKYTEKPWGKHRIAFHKIDGTVLMIENAGFLKNIYNRNDVWIGENPADELDFESNGINIKVPWSKIHTITPIKTKSSDKSEEVLLASKDGTKIKGRAIRGLTIKRIKGIIALGEGYKLLIEISLMIDDPPTFMKIEFK